MKQFIRQLSLVLIAMCNLIFTQDVIAVLPMQSDILEPHTVQTVNILWQQEIAKLTNMKFVPEREIKELMEDEVCNEITCAIELGRQLHADQVALCSLDPLGEKIFIQYMLVDINNEKIIIADNTSSLTLEDLDTVIKRVAKSVARQKPFDQTVEIGTIKDKENENIHRRRQARKYFGFSFGYLYPNHGYDDVEKSFTYDFRREYEMEKFNVGFQGAYRRGLALTLYSNYLTTKTDFCPYVGGALGFHWVMHEDDFEFDDGTFGDDLRNDGFEVSLKTGIKAFRTYNFQVNVNLDFTYTFNDYDDQAIV